MKTKLKNLWTAIITIGLFSSCVNDTFEKPIQENCVAPGITKTKEVSGLYAEATTATKIYSRLVDNVEVPEYLEAIVVSSDEGGNFYKSMYLQPVDGSKGFNLSIDIVNAYSQKFQPGKKVFVKINGLAFANPTSFAGGLILGAAPTAVYAVDRISSKNISTVLTPTCETVKEDEIVRTITIDQAKSDTYLNTLVEIENVQFEGDCGTFDANLTDTSDSSIYITDGAKSLVIRTSRFANFAGYNIPTGKGKIRGILTRYNTTYQIILRTDRDVKFTEPRIDYTLPLVGNNLQFLTSVSENFTAIPVSSGGANMPKYINDAVNGSRYWDVKSFSSNNYLQMSAFGAGCAYTYFIMPISFDATKELSFKTKDGYNNGEVLKVYYSTDYVQGGDLKAATLVDITSNFSIARGTVTGYATSFTNSGVYKTPATLSGNGYFIFEYGSSGVATTTIQIDDILVK